MRARVLEELSLRDAEKHPKLRRWLEWRQGRGRDLARQEFDAEAETKRLNSLSEEERLLEIGRRATRQADTQKATDRLYTEFRRQATSPLLDDERFPGEETLQALLNKPDVGAFTAGIFDEGFRAGLAAGKKDKAVREAIRQEILRENRAGETTPKSVPAGTAGGQGMPSLADIKAMSAKDYAAWEKQNPEQAKQLYESLGQRIAR